jgi:hypothetical protein
METPEIDKEEAITYMSLFFVDIVGLSDPIISTNTPGKQDQGIEQIDLRMPNIC